MPAERLVLTILALMVAAALAGAAGFAASAEVAPTLAGSANESQKSSLTDLEQQVADTERAFAKTMADRNHGAFVSFLAEEAIFFGNAETLRGRAAVAEGWKRYFEGGAAPFSWEPDRVAVLASGALAFSSGPVRDPSGARVGTFNSVWQRQADGRWKIIFDKGCP